MTGEYTDPNKLSQCCAVPMFSDSDICTRCKEHTGTMSAEEDDEE